MTTQSTKPIRPSLRLTREEHELLKAEAQRQSRSIEGQLRHMVRSLAGKPNAEEAA